MSRSAPVTGFLDAAWPAVTAEALVYSLLADAARAVPAPPAGS